MKLTGRDLEIIRFVLNMKFASAEDIHEKFFKRRRDGEISKSHWYTRERLRELMLDGYLTTVRYRFENKCYYIGTKNGYKLVYYYLHGASETAKPIEQIDVRTFEHDQKVMRCRLLLEENEKVTDWTSDRQLKMLHAEYFNSQGSRDSAPDAVYKTADGRTIAFEYEIAQKSKGRYQSKIQKYGRCFVKSPFCDHPEYDHVHIVCEKESVRDILVSASGIYRDQYTVELARDFLARHAFPLNTVMPRAASISG